MMSDNCFFPVWSGHQSWPPMIHPAVRAAVAMAPIVVFFPHRTERHFGSSHARQISYLAGLLRYISDQNGRSSSDAAAGAGCCARCWPPLRRSKSRKFSTPLNGIAVSSNVSRSAPSLSVHVRDE